MNDVSDFGHKLDACVACEVETTELWGHKRRWYTGSVEGSEFQIFRCRACGTGFLNPPPSNELLGKIYQFSGHALTEPVSLRQIKENEQRFPNSTVDATRMANVATKLNSSRIKHALDVGSGYGFLTKSLRDHGYDVTSINPGQYENEVFAELNGYSPKPVMFDQFVAQGNFGVIVMSQVLEHIVRPAEAVEKVSAMLEKGGIFACAVPNFEALTVKILGTRDNACLWVPEHVNYFTIKGLRMLLERHGLKPVRQDQISRFRYDALSRRLSNKSNAISGVLDRFVEFGQKPVNLVANKLGMGVFLNVYAQKL